MVASSSAIGAPGQSPVAARAVGNPKLDATAPNRRDWRAAQIPAAKGQSSAQGLGRIYAAIATGGALDGQTIISPTGIDRLRAVRHPGPDMLLGPRQCAAGVAMNVLPIFGPHPETFGHSGWGGSCAFADPERRLGCAYVMNRQSRALLGDIRPKRLIEAAYAAL